MKVKLLLIISLFLVLFSISSAGAVLPPKADFTYTPKSPDTSDNIQFIDNSTDPDGGSIEHWLWLFGDGENSTLQNPTHSYADDGTYTVQLFVVDDERENGSTSKDITVANVPPSAHFTYTPCLPAEKIIDFGLLKRDGIN